MVYVALVVSLALFVSLTFKRLSPLLVAPIVTAVLALVAGIDPRRRCWRGIWAWRVIM